MDTRWRSGASLDSEYLTADVEAGPSRAGLTLEDRDVDPWGARVEECPEFGSDVVDVALLFRGELTDREIYGDLVTTGFNGDAEQRRGYQTDERLDEHQDDMIFPLEPGVDHAGRASGRQWAFSQPAGLR
jgi:hypothetical protein